MRNSYCVRGATSVEMDSPAEVDAAVKELFGEIYSRNSLVEDDITCVMLSQTSDIKTRNAAAALRKGGFCPEVPLFCVQEAEVTGMMRMVVRAMVVVGRTPSEKPRHVYLRRTAALRPDLAEE